MKKEDMEKELEERWDRLGRRLGNWKTKFPIGVTIWYKNPENPNQEKRKIDFNYFTFNPNNRTYTFNIDTSKVFPKEQIDAWSEYFDNTVYEMREEAKIQLKL